MSHCAIAGRAARHLAAPSPRAGQHVRRACSSRSLRAAAPDGHETKFKKTDNDEEYESLPTYPPRPSFKAFKNALRPASQVVVFEGCPNDPYRASSTPLYQTSTFRSPSASEFGAYDYTRSGNPTRRCVFSLRRRGAPRPIRQYCMGCTEGSAACVVRDVAPERCERDGAELTKVTLEKGEQNRAFGARVVDTETKDFGLMIVRISAGGALSEWNARNPSMAVSPGDSIVEANGFTEPWAIMEEMARVVKVGMVVRRAPPGGRALLAQCKVTEQSLQTTALVLKQTVQACDVSVDTCAICLEDVEADERIAGLKCGHGFHQRCIMRWLGRCETSGCPLCREAVH